MRNGLILLAVVLAACVGHYAYWHHQAGAKIALIDKNIAALNAFYGTANSRSVFAYKETALTGWPLHSIIVLKDASLAQTAGLARYEMKTDALWVTEKDGSFRLDFPEAFTGKGFAGQGATEDFAFVPTPHPTLMLRTPEAQKEATPKGNPFGQWMAGQAASASAAPDIVYQFRAELSPKLRLDVNRTGEKTAVAEFDIPSAYLVGWHPLPASLTNPVGFFFDLMGEMADRANPKPATAIPPAPSAAPPAVGTVPTPIAFVLPAGKAVSASPTPWVARPLRNPVGEADFRKQAAAFRSDEVNAFRVEGQTLPVARYCNENALSAPETIEIYYLEDVVGTSVLLCTGQLDGETNQVTIFAAGQPVISRHVAPNPSTYRLSPEQLAETVTAMLKRAQEERGGPGQPPLQHKVQ